MSPEQTRNPTARLGILGIRAITGIESALAGLLVAFVLATLIANDDRGNSVSVAMAAPLGCVGGFFSGILLASAFGRPGWRGWGLAFLASAVSPSIAGGIAGTFIMPGAGNMFGALEPLKIVHYPLALTAWLFCFVTVHTHIRYLREKLTEPFSAPDIGDDKEAHEGSH